MQFNSYIFIFILPLLVVAYFLLNRINEKIGKYVLLISSIGFYLYGGIGIAYILGISIVINYLVAVLLGKIANRRKAILTIGIVFNVALLIFYKYVPFTVENLNAALNTNIVVKEIVLPLAISFFTFSQITYIVGVYRNDIEKIDCLDYLLFILYFPKLISGPIMEPVDFITQINDSARKRFDIENVSAGARIFAFGLFKKMLLADTFSAVAEWGLSNTEILTSADIVILMLSYTFEIYFDFSGYCDMGLGVSQIFNIDLPINFDSPYKAMSIREFWKRWHISLTSFFTRYIYIPLGGSKKGKIRTYINTLIVFLISGIWHGANWTFILWGILHGLCSIFNRVTENICRRCSPVIRWLLSFSVVNVLWLLFASDSIFTWKKLVSRMIHFEDISVTDKLVSKFVLSERTLIANVFDLDVLNNNVCMIVLLICALVICLVPENNYRTRKSITYVGAILGVLAFVYGFICLGTESTFVYFGF